MSSIASVSSRGDSGRGTWRGVFHGELRASRGTPPQRKRFAARLLRLRRRGQGQR
jgi:hypothetical protein